MRELALLGVTVGPSEWFVCALMHKRPRTALEEARADLGVTKGMGYVHTLRPGLSRVSNGLHRIQQTGAEAMGREEQTRRPLTIGNHLVVWELPFPAAGDHASTVVGDSAGRCVYL